MAGEMIRIGNFYVQQRAINKVMFKVWLGPEKGMGERLVSMEELLNAHAAEAIATVSGTAESTVTASSAATTTTTVPTPLYNDDDDVDMDQDQDGLEANYGDRVDEVPDAQGLNSLNIGPRSKPPQNRYLCTQPSSPPKQGSSSSTSSSSSRRRKRSPSPTPPMTPMLPKIIKRRREETDDGGADGGQE